MSWLTGLAGKAENLLNNIDQVAGQALHNENEAAERDWKAKPATEPYSPYLSQAPPAAPSQQNSTNTMSASFSVPSNLNQMNSETNYNTQMSRSMYSTTTTSSSGSRTPTRVNGAKKDSDEDLLAFLNSPEAESGKKRPNNKPILNGKHSRQSSTSSSVSNKSGKVTESVGLSADVAVDLSSIERPRSATPHESKEEAPISDSSSGYFSTQENGSTPQGQVSSVELENQLLKNEVASLNQEMTTVMRRTKTAQEELSGMKRRMTEQQQHMARGEQAVRDLRARENDLLEGLTTKDSQLGILRVRLEEADKEVEAKKKTIKQIQGEKNRILQDHTSATGVQGQALDSLKDKLTEAQQALKREKDAYANLQRESSERQSSLEAAQHNLAESLSSAQKKLNEEKTRVSELSLQLKTSKGAVEGARNELQEYKDKASRILQSKDKLISSLKEGSSGGGGELAAGAVISAELEEVRTERAMLKEELQRVTLSLEALRGELAELETSAQQEADGARENAAELEEQLAAERARREDAETEASGQKQELRFAHEELIKQKTAFQSRLGDKDAEIAKLRHQLTTRSASSTSELELENRLHALTESLIQKQTMLEAIGTEKNSLVLQLERLEKQYRELETSSIRATAATVNMADDDEVRQRLPGFLRESAADNDVTRKVKRAAGSIDKFSIRLGVFLRRYPIARVMVIVYMVLLHLWVMIVLMTYQPEMHGVDYNPHPPHG